MTSSSNVGTVSSVNQSELFALLELMKTEPAKAMNEFIDKIRSIDASGNRDLANTWQLMLVASTNGFIPTAQQVNVTNYNQGPITMTNQDNSIRTGDTHGVTVVGSGSVTARDITVNISNIQKITNDYAKIEEVKSALIAAFKEIPTITASEDTKNDYLDDLQKFNPKLRKVRVATVYA